MSHDPKDKWHSWQHPGKLCHPDSPAGGAGTGSSRPPGYSADLPSLSRLPHPDSPAGRSFDWQRSLSRVHVEETVSRTLRELDRAVSFNALLRVARNLLGPASFDLGVCYGLGEKGAEMAGALLTLGKTFVLAGLYDASNLPAWSPGPLMILHLQAKVVALVWGPALKKAHDERDELVSELKKALSHPGELLSGLAKGVADEYAAKWRRLEGLLGDPSLHANFEAGRVFGEVLFDILMLVTTVGDAIRAAKVLAEIPQLVKLAKGFKEFAAAAGKLGEREGGGAAAKAGKTVEEGKVVKSIGSGGKSGGGASRPKEPTAAVPASEPAPSTRASAESTPIESTSTTPKKARTPTDRYKEHLTDRDLDAARREAKGEVVARKADGTPWDHQHEVRDAQRGLLNRIEQIKRRLSRPGLSEAEREALTSELSEASTLLDKSEGYLPR